MHHHFTSGAINKNTTEFELPYEATKENSYSCPHCSNDVTLRKGKIRVHHFAHKKETSSCSYYTKPSRNHIINDLKMILKTLFVTNKQPIWFISECNKQKCRTETLSMVSTESMAGTIIRYDKSSNFILFENTMLQTNEELIKEVEVKYENSIERLEMELIEKQIKDLSESSPSRYSSIANPFEMRSIFDMESNGDEVPTICRELRIAEDEVEELNNMLSSSLSLWRVYTSKSKSAGTNYYHNKRSNLTTWCVPSDVTREEEIIITNKNINKIKSLEKELSEIEIALQTKMNDEYKESLKEQEKNRYILLEIIDENESSSRYGMNSFEVPNMNVSIERDHKHIIMTANNLMDQYYKYMEREKQKELSRGDSDEDSKISSSNFKKSPFKVKCNLFNSFTCSLCVHKENESKKREAKIKCLFYEKYPQFKKDKPTISYRTTDSPPTVKAEETKKRKKLLMERMREHKLFAAFRQDFLVEQRIAAAAANSRDRHK